MISIDLSGLQQLQQKLRELKETCELGAVAGWPEGTPAHILERVKYMEYNPQDRSPEWAVLRKTRLRLYSKGVGEMFKEAWGQGLRGEALWDAIGRQMAGMVRETLTGLDSPELKESTVRLKMARGMSEEEARKIFIRTKESYNAIAHRVVKREEAVDNLAGPTPGVSTNWDK